ncbi:DNA (cytosine-5-)-methyltransferase [Tissierella praeacuta]|uniref:DNA (cytosine-5-)-methyltransferase n=1 Tax=Tissierella praeacuta TaxID=43131 RepID=UPI001C1196A4|nr:DNA (cytosine-5-)-methyltransferase [Tissierella praeacuta]MBU5257121.1 DNA (cytosine-5-)-methyltransferase [Tissierella praeacuta]
MYINKVRVREAMERIGIKTQTELADKLGISKNQLSAMLSEKYNPLKARVAELCDVLNIKPNEILDYEKEDVVVNFAEINEEEVTAIEVFTGAGGLALGLEQAGIHTVQFVEIDKFCCETLKQNRPEWNVINEDIAKVDFTMFKGKVDIVTGGSPCQAFSYSGKKLGFEDTRGTLFYEFARTVKEVEPLIFMFENVRGLISHDKGRTLETILSVLKELGYNVKYEVLNANDYGVAQKRERIIIIGTKDGIEFEYPKKLDYKPVLRDALKDVPQSEGQTYSEKKRKVLELVPPGGCWVDLPEELQKEYMGKSYYSGGGKRGMARRISWDEPSLTLTCSPSQKQTERCHPEETRPFTVREYARIQSFPDSWEFAGGIGQKYKQIGNAVPVELARHLGVQLVKAISEFKNRDSD